MSLSLAPAPAPAPIVPMNQHRPLDGREVEAVALLLKGLRDEEIGARLGIDATEVKQLFRSACEKVGAEGRLGLIIHAIYFGYVPPPV